MTDVARLEKVFLENLPTIERVSHAMARRNGVPAAEWEDFVSWVKLRFIEDDYASLSKFRGESSIGTYLTVVIAMLARDYRVQHWGRWRPTAAARRLGDLAVRLETHVRRDGYRLSEAGEILRSRGDTSLSDRELADLLRQLPDRAELRPANVGPEKLNFVDSGSRADHLVNAGEQTTRELTARRAISDALDSLPAEDQAILRLHYFEGLTVAEIARGLGLEQKPLYRRLGRLLAALRKRLALRGIRGEALDELRAAGDAE